MDLQIALTILLNIGGLVHGLQQAKSSDYSPLHFIEDSGIVLSKLRTRHPPRKTHMVRLFQDARAVANDLDVSCWGHRYRTNKKWRIDWRMSL